MKKIFTFLMSAALGLAAQASLLYFQVESKNSANGLYYNSGTGAFSFNGKEVYGANVMVSSDSGKSYSSAGVWFDSSEYIAPGTSTDPTLSVEYGDIKTSGTSLIVGTDYVVDLGEISGAGYTFYIELIGYDKAAFGEGNRGVIAVGDVFTYSDLVSAGSIIESGFATGDQIWTGGAYNVPEPSGALLMLMGLALAGLKRRKV